MDRIEAIRCFVAVAREGSFTAAAARLGRSTKFVSKYVAALEDHLRAQLFNRTTRSVALTDTGRSCLDRCQPLLDQFDELEQAVSEEKQQLSGLIRLTAPTGFGSTRLVRLLDPFLKEHPKIRLEMQLSDSRVSLVDEGIDLAIRIGALESSSLIARKLADMPRIACAADSYLQHAGKPGRPEDLSQFECLIDGTMKNPKTWRFFVSGREVSVAVDGRYQLNTPLALTELALTGAGIVLAPYYTVERHLKSGELKALFPASMSPASAVYALYPLNRYLAARLRALIDHLAKELEQQSMYG